MSSFGSFIKDEREKNDWTQTEFGAKIGINSSAISRIEHGTQTLSANKLGLLAKLFSVDLTKIKELYFGDKFAKEALNFDCPETVFAYAERRAKYMKSTNTKQTKLKFDKPNEA